MSKSINYYKELVNIISEMSDKDVKALYESLNTKSIAKADTKSKFDQVGFLEFDRQYVRFTEDKFCPKPVFNGITYALKQSGAKYDKDNKCWVFPSVKAANEFKSEQKKREAEYNK